MLPRDPIIWSLAAVVVVCVAIVTGYLFSLWLEEPGNDRY